MCVNRNIKGRHKERCDLHVGNNIIIINRFENELKIKIVNELKCDLLFLFLHCHLVKNIYVLSSFILLS